MQVTSGLDLLAKELRDIHSAEQMLSRGLPRLSRQVSDDRVRQKLEQRVEEGKEILEAVDQELEELEISVGRSKNVVMEGFLDDANQLIQDIEVEEVLDAAVVAEIQKIQHYCIAAWGTTAAYAREMEEEQLVDAMERALEDGKRFDEELNRLAEEEINPRVFEMEEGEEEEDGRGRSQRGRSAQTSGRQSSGSRRSSGSGGREASSRREARGGNGGRSRSSGQDSDLRQREYRDQEGRVHHHTRTYLARHRGRKS